ncbi:hypothetical protein COY95_04595 [Candidatus Woesearchaeota archaeon CG_4_10_14_0_8_um_filter_47_5]|nr:MAG: hypothetical protein COY95_04595 [Candidatus Woesearchaeota archaeon CG_4_10_14_0_8_um_filter_47_5]
MTTFISSPAKLSLVKKNETRRGQPERAGTPKYHGAEGCINKHASTLNPSITIHHKHKKA